MEFINRYCHIRNYALVDQGRTIYEDNRADLGQFLDGAFASLKSSYPKFHKMDRLSKLGFLASELLIKDVVPAIYTPQQLALVLSNAHASLDTDVRYFESTRSIASPALFVYTLPNIVAGEICIRHGLKGENAFFISPSFDAIQMTTYVKTVMAAEKTQACLAGWIDVMGEQHDVFLYLVEKQAGAHEHTAAELQKLYRLNYGTTHG